MYYKATRDIYAQLSRKYKEELGLNVEEMADLCRAPLELVVHVMNNEASREKLHFPSIRITGFGMFFVGPWKVDKLKERYGKNLNPIQPGEVQPVDDAQTSSSI